MSADRVKGWPVFLAALVCGGSLVHAACGGAPSGGAQSPNGSASSAASSASSASTAGSASASSDATEPEDDDATSDSYSKCTVETATECYEHADQVSQVIGALVEVEDENDVRSVPLAEQAIQIPDAMVREEGLRLLGQFARDCNVARTALPLLNDPHPRVQAMAAEVLHRCGDTSDLANMWAKGGFVTSDFMDVYERAPKIDPTLWGFPAYPGATPYATAHTKHGVAFSTHDDVATVAAFYSRALSSPIVETQEIMRRNNDVTSKLGDQMKAQAAQLEPLMQQYMKTHDPKVLAQIEKLNHASAQPAELTDFYAGPLGTLNLPSRGDVQSSLRFVVVDEGEHKPGKLVAIYREPIFDLTVIQLSWHPKAHTAPIPRPMHIPLR